MCLLAWKVSSRKNANAHHFVDNETPDAHHSSTSVVQFNSALLQLGGLIKVVPSKVEGAIAVVTDEFRLVIKPFCVTVDNFGHGEEGQHLQENVLSILGLQKSRERFETVRDAFGAREANSGSMGQVSGDGQHANTSVLDFVFSEQVELFLASISDQTQRIEKTKLRIDGKKT